MATCGANAGTVFDGLSLTGTLSFLAVSYLGLKIGWSLLRTLYSSLLASPLDLSKWKGGWAVVTGATDGIGKAYAKAMAKKGLNNTGEMMLLTFCQTESLEKSGLE